MEHSPDWIKTSPVLLNLNGPAMSEAHVGVIARLEEDGGIAAVEDAAERHAGKVAVADNDLTLTFAEVVDRAYGLAAELIARFPAGAIVTSLVRNSAAAPIVVLASAIAGVVLVPIDAGHPRERQAAISQQSGAVALLLSAAECGVDDSFIPADLPRIIVDATMVGPVARPTSRYDEDAPQFVAFTSGSTGRPKGIAVSGRYGNALLAQFVARFQLGDQDTILSLASLSAGGSRDAFLALATGATIRICDIDSGFAEILRIMDAGRITVLSFVPSALRMILEIPGASSAFRHLRVLDLHGERILASDIAFLREHLPPSCHISVTMGSVEAGAIFSWFVDDTKINGATVPVGYVLPGRQVALLDEEGAPVDRGEVGELIVRGVMSLGAWHDGRVVPGPFLSDPDDPASRIYPMGDLMRERSDGLFEFVARKDRQVKVHGLWADLGEVEAALRTLPAVADVAVISIDQDGQRERLAAFVVIRRGAVPPSRAEMARIVAAQAAEHMVPTDYQMLAKIPRLANFKPDMVKLRTMIIAEPQR